MFDAKTMREWIKSGKTMIGPFSRCADPAMAEICGYGGFDFIVIDMEHGPNNPFTLQNICRGCDVAGIASLVRVSSIEEINKALDVGATGVQVPQVGNAEYARKAIAAAKFFPDGERGVCRFVRAAKYSAKDRFDYFRDANDTIVILQIEGQEGLDNLDEILEVPGIDIIFVGPYDLSQSLGIPGQVNHPRVEEAVEEIVAKCKAKGIAVGTFCDTIENGKKWIAKGVQYIDYCIDVGLFYSVCSETVKALRG
jgi:4-hydroxy-2-oxoheptanedioate aldolase